MRQTMTRFRSAYLWLWLMTDYVVFRLFWKQATTLDFRFWENDITAVCLLGWIILTVKVFNLGIKK